METYWSLRWLLQEGLTRLEAVVLRENLVRVQGLPLVARERRADARAGHAGAHGSDRGRSAGAHARLRYRETLAKVQDATEEAGQKA